MRIEESLTRECHPRLFGRKGTAATIAAAQRSTLVEDVKLFALTFACGFLFVSLYLA